MDNAENNAVAMKELQDLFEEDGITFDHLDNRINCYPHIINICVSHIVSSLTKVDIDDLDIGDSDDDGDDDSGYVGAADDREVIDSTQINTDELKEWFFNLKRDPVNRARKLVRTVRASGQRKEDLLAMIRTGNQTGMFRDREGNPATIKELQLIKDVKHRWDSMYFMLSRLQELRQVMYIPL